MKEIFWNKAHKITLIIAVVIWLISVWIMVWIDSHTAQAVSEMTKGCITLPCPKPLPPLLHILSLYEVWIITIIGLIVLYVIVTFISYLKYRK